jgi:hypothetical protein
MKNKLLTFLTITLITVLVLYFSLKDDYEIIINTIVNINKFSLLISFFFLILYYFIRSLVMRNFVNEFNKKYTIRDSLNLTFKTNFFHAVTPFSTGGQPYEIYSLNKSSLKLTDAVNVSVENFIVYQIALVALGFISIVLNHILHVLNSSVLRYILTLGFLINLMVIVVLFWITLSKKTDQKVLNFLIHILSKLKIIKNEEKTKLKLHNYLSEFNDGSKKLLENKAKFFLMILLEFISLISLYLVPFALLKGINVDINPLQTVITMSYVMLIGSFIPLPGGSGGLEYSFVSFFSTFLSGGRLNAIMLVWRFITYYFGMILGAILLNFKKENK